jgi:hypothetical protein
MLPTEVAGVDGRSSAFVVVAVVSGAVAALALVVGAMLCVKVNRAAGLYISDRLGVRMRFWGAYVTPEAWQRAIRRKVHDK